MRRLCMLLGTVGLLAGCPGPAPIGSDGGDAGGPQDSGLHTDAGFDAGPLDAGPPDAGPPDAGPRCTGRTLGSGDFSRSLSSGGRTRNYLLHVPAQYQSAVPSMLVVAIHGLYMTPAAMKQLTHFDEVANERGFLVAYPEGYSQSFNAGLCCGTSAAMAIDDVAFIRAMLDAIEADFCIDPSRVHATGFSNGGFMSHRLGCELAGRFASIGPVAGQMGVSPCTPGRPVPVAMAHGTADVVVPYGGNPLLGYLPTVSTMNGWAARDGCAASPTRLWSDGGNTADTWAGCDGGAEVTLYTLGGAGHDWMGGGTGWDAGAFNTTRVLTGFFERHPRP